MAQRTKTSPLRSTSVLKNPGIIAPFLRYPPGPNFRAQKDDGFSSPRTQSKSHRDDRTGEDRYDRGGKRRQILSATK